MKVYGFVVMATVATAMVSETCRDLDRRSVKYVLQGAKLVVCNPRKNALLKRATSDAHKLAELLRGNNFKQVYHGQTGVHTLQELSRSYLTTVQDLTWVIRLCLWVLVS